MGVPRPFQAKHMGLGSTPSRGLGQGAAHLPATRAEPQATLLQSSLPRWLSESPWGSGPSGPASGQEAVCRRAQHCPRLCAHPQMCSCGSALTPPVLGAPGQRHPTARMEKSGLAGAGRASTLLSGVGVAGRRFHFPAGSLPIFHI